MTTWSKCHTCQNAQSLHMLIEYNGYYFCLGNPKCIETYLAAERSESGEQTDDEQQSEQTGLR